MSDITAQALEEARNGGNICSFCHGFGTQKQWHAQDFDSDPQGHHVYVKCDHCDGSGVEPTTPQPTTTLPQSEEHDRDWCAHSVYRGNNVCTGTIGTPTGDKITCPCKCHAEEPSHPDTLREKVLNLMFEYSNNNITDEAAYETITLLLSQEKERWENELREKVEGLMLRVAGFDSVREDEVYNAALSNVLALISKRKE